MITGIAGLSQHIDVKSKYWKSRSCGIVSLKMAMDYCGLPKKNVNLSELIKKGVKIGAYDKRWGWIHAGLVNLAKIYGYAGQNYDWFGDTPQKAYAKLVKKFKYPIIASIHSGLDQKNPGHLVVITGISKEKIYYNDPDSKTRKNIKRTAPVKKFLKGWKRRIIILKPKK